MPKQEFFSMLLQNRAYIYLPCSVTVGNNYFNPEVEGRRDAVQHWFGQDRTEIKSISRNARVLGYKRAGEV